MTYNMHPLFVHFPIAFLFVYSAIKVLPLERLLPRVSWKHIERALLLLGVLGAFAALSTGELAEQLVRPDSDLVEAHSFFADTATALYAFLLLGEVLSFFEASLISRLKMPALEKPLFFVKNILVHPAFSRVLAVLGLIAISLTGLLGGAIVYGTSADPMAGIVMNLLGIRQ